MTKNAFPYHEDAIAETGASLEKADGSYAEAVLYNELRKQLPPEWSFIWGTQLGCHQYDFLVLVPGQGIVNLECKGKGYKFIGATNRFEFYDKKTGRKEEKDLVGQAIKASKSYITYLGDALFGHGARWGLMGHAVVFPIDEHAGINLRGVPIYRASDCRSTGIGLIAIVNNAFQEARKTLAEYGVSHPALLSESDARTVWNFWTQKEQPSVHNLAYRRNSLASYRCSMDQTLTVSQSMLMHSLLAPQDCNVLVEGIAGSGKTFLAVAAAMKADGKILLVCFNKVLARYLDLTTPTKDGLTISHFHGLHDLLLPGFELPLRDAHESEANYFERVDKAYLMAARALEPGTYPRFDMILVDEAQDLNSTQLRFLSRFRRNDGPTSGKMILFASQEQKLYPKRLTPADLATLLPALKQLPPLDLNLRNSKSISAHCDEILGSQTMAVLEGPAVSFVKLSIPELPEFLSRLLLQFNPSDLAVISPEHRFLDKVCMTDGVSFYGPDVKLAKTQKNLKAWKENKCAWKSTTYAFKGLEAMAVVHLVPEGYSQTELRYVGASRATYQLYVCEIVSQ